MKERGVFCRDCMTVHWSGQWPKECVEARQNTKRGSVSAPYIRSDGMEAIVNHADGKMYDSKSRFERAVKDAGCEILGNDTPDAPTIKEPSLADIAGDVKTAIQQVEAGYHG